MESRMILQLDPPIPVETPRGKALAQLVVDYGPEHDLLWVCFQDDTKECWTWGNQQIRAQTNVTMNRPSSAQTTVSFATDGTGTSDFLDARSGITKKDIEAFVTRLPTGT
jgi:hypothetical protein